MKTIIRLVLVSFTGAALLTACQKCDNKTFKANFYTTVPNKKIFLYINPTC